MIGAFWPQRERRRRLAGTIRSKRAPILGLCLCSPTGAPIVCVAEKNGIQTPDRTQLELFTQARLPRLLSAAYKRHAMTCRLASLGRSVQDAYVHKPHEAQVRMRRWRLTLHFTPTTLPGSSKSRFGACLLFRRNILQDALSHAGAKFVSHIIEYTCTYLSERAKPLHWTYTGKPLAAWILLLAERGTREIRGIVIESVSGQRATFFAPFEQSRGGGQT